MEETIVNLAGDADLVIGVDTHLDTHTAAMCDAQGRVVAQLQVPNISVCDLPCKPTVTRSVPPAHAAVGVRAGVLACRSGECGVEVLSDCCRGRVPGIPSAGDPDGGDAAGAEQRVQRAGDLGWAGAAGDGQP